MYVFFDVSNFILGIIFYRQKQLRKCKVVVNDVFYIICSGSRIGKSLNIYEQEESFKIIYLEISCSEYSKE